MSTHHPVLNDEHPEGTAPELVFHARRSAVCLASVSTDVLGFPQAHGEIEPCSRFVLGTGEEHWKQLYTR
jgi:hypothetical protein